MVKISSIIIGLAIVVGSSNATLSAQTIGQQQTNQLQSPTQTQSTQSLQNQQSQVQQNNSAGALSGGQPESLKVLSSPSQTDSNVSVGRSGSTKSEDSSNSASLWLAALLIPILAGAYLFLRSFLASREIKKPEEAVVQELSIDEKPRAKKTKNTTAQDKKPGIPTGEDLNTKPAQKTASKTKTQTKKKKKKNHR